MPGCPICKSTDGPEVHVARPGYRVDCPRCGRFGIEEETVEDHNREQSDPATVDRRSHAIRHQSDLRPSALFRINTEIFTRLLAESRISVPTEQADNLIIWLGSRPGDPASAVSLRVGAVASVAGARSGPESVRHLVAEMRQRGWLVPLTPGRSDPSNAAYLRLTRIGWERYDKVRSAVPDT